MILHKENTLKAEPFYKSINDLSVLDANADNRSDYASNDLKMLEKYSYFIQNLMAFEQEIKSDTNVKILMSRFLKYLKAIIPVKQIGLMFYDEFNRELLPVDEEEDSKIAKTMNHFNKEGIFSVIFNERKTITVPDLDNYDSDGPRLFYLIFPVYDVTKNYGILSLLTSLDETRISELEKKSINVFLNLVLGKLEKLKLKDGMSIDYILYFRNNENGKIIEMPVNIVLKDVE